MLVLHHIESSADFNSSVLTPSSAMDADSCHLTDADAKIQRRWVTVG